MMSAYYNIPNYSNLHGAWWDDITLPTVLPRLGSFCTKIWLDFFTISMTPEFENYHVDGHHPLGVGNRLYIGPNTDEAVWSEHK